MTKKFCPYCGGPIGYCKCEAEAEDEREEFFDQYYSDPEICAGLAQQDYIDLARER